MDKMDIKLHEMKQVDEYALEHKLSEDENYRVNGELNALKEEFSTLEKRFNLIVTLQYSLLKNKTLENPTTEFSSVFL